jgi:hypothetical protein
VEHAATIFKADAWQNEGMDCEDGESKFLLHRGNFAPGCITLHPKRQFSVIFVIVNNSARIWWCIFFKCLS